MRYQLYYWPGIAGRGEFVRLALEEAGVDYVDVARRPAKKGGGIPAIFRFIDGKSVAHPPFAPPYLRIGTQLIGQTANILLFLGRRHGLAPAGETGRLWTNQLQLTLADFADEAHDTHHPIASELYYEDQRKEALRRAHYFRKSRIPKFLGYFERVLERNPSAKYLTGSRLTYADLSLFHVVAGLRYAFPRTMAAADKRHRRVLALHDRVAARPRIRAYLESDRCPAFDEQGMFRHYPALDK